MGKIAVLVDHHLLFADAFAALLEKIGFFERVYILNDEKKRMNFFLHNSRKEVYLFLDYYLGDHLGIDVVNDVRRFNKNTKVVFVSSITKMVAIRTIMASQPEGFVSKSAGFDIILECLDKLNRNETYYCSIITDILNQTEKHEEALLTLREIEILEYFAKGFSVNETADKFFLSKHTIVAHRRKMMKKTKTNSITDLLSYVRKTGLIMD